MMMPRSLCSTGRISKYFPAMRQNKETILDLIKYYFVKLLRRYVSPIIASGCLTSCMYDYPSLRQSQICYHRLSFDVLE